MRRLEAKPSNKIGLSGVMANSKIIASQRTSHSPLSYS